MGRNFPSRRIRHRFTVWRDRRRYPWRYADTETRRFGRRAPRIFRRRFFVIRSVEDTGGIDHFIFAECPHYEAAMEVAAFQGDRVYTEGQMLDHPERRRALTAWDRGEAPHQGRQASAAASPRRTTSTDSFSTTMEAPNG
jgi:hypothetical protein